jgi:hypothetical protein
VELNYYYYKEGQGNANITNLCYHLALLATCFHAGFLLGLFFDLEDGGNIFLRNLSWLSTDYMTYPKRLYSS